MCAVAASAADDILNQTASFFADVCTFGKFHNSCKDFSDWSHDFLKNIAPYKEGFDDAEFVINTALLADGLLSVSNIVRNFPKKFSIGELSLAGLGKTVPVLCVDGSVTLATPGDLASIGRAEGAFYNMESNSSGGDGDASAFGKDGLTKEQRNYYDEQIENASTDEEADRIRYERNKVSRENRELKPYESYEAWYKDVERIRKNSSQGRQAEQEARNALNDLGIDIENNNAGSVETYTDGNGVTTRPDGVGTDANGNKVIHEHKHFTTSEDQVVYRSKQIKAEQEMANKSGENVDYYVTMSSDTPIAAGAQPAPRPSGPLAESTDNIYYLDRGSGKITYEWSKQKGIWVKIN